MSNATSYVNFFQVIDNSTASILQFGDRKSTYQRNQSLNILQTIPTSLTGEPYFTNYAMFREPFPNIKIFMNHFFNQLEEATESVPETSAIALPPVSSQYMVNKVNIINSSLSSNIQIGNGCFIRAESRTKNFLQDNRIQSQTIHIKN